MAQELMVQGGRRLIQGSQGPGPVVGQGDMDNPAILLAAYPVDEPRPFQPVDEARDPRDDSDGAAGDLQNRQRPPFASQDAQDVVPRRRQAMSPQQPGKANLNLVAGTQDAQGRFLFRRLEGPLLLEFVLQLRGRHGSVRAVRSPANSLYVIYLHVKSFARILSKEGGRAGRAG
jgi:hypothetical protein